MAIKGAEYAVSRVVATLQAYLPTELNLIDSEMADGLTLDDVANGDYFEAERTMGDLNSFPAIVVNVESTDPISIKSTTNTPGLYEAHHTITASVHLRDNGNETPDIMKHRILRYARAIERVLFIKYPTMPASGDETVVMLRREGSATYITEGQAPGEFVRTARIPFIAWTHEAL